MSNIRSMTTYVSAEVVDGDVQSAHDQCRTEAVKRLGGEDVEPEGQSLFVKDGKHCIGITYKREWDDTPPAKPTEESEA